MKKTITRVAAFVLTVVMVVGILPLSAFATIPNWEDNNVIFDGTSFGTNGYYNVISKKDYVLVPGAAVESEIVLNNATGTRRQVLHIIEVDPSNPDVSIVPGYHQIDKLAEDPKNEANWSHKELTEMAKYYEDNLGYNIVGGMNTDLYYDTYAPRILVYNGKSIGVKGEYSPSSSILYVFKDAEGNVSCDVKAYNKADFDKYLADGVLLHAVSVSFGMVVKDGELVNKKEVRESSGDAARSMVGVKADGTLVICMNDGRGANNSEGLSGDFEEGEVMLALGCQWAANCDGGGSSTFLTKRVGEENFEMRSVPCDGAQRPTAHGIFVASNVAPTGILNNVNVEANYDIFAPKTVYNFTAEAIDTHGYAMDMPADATWTLSDASFGTIENGKFVSNGKKGTVDVQILSGGQVVGSRTITVADPEVFKLSATSTVVPYSTPEKIRTITLPIVAMTGEANVYVDTNAVSVALSNEAAGVLDGFKFTATSDTSIAGVDVTVTYGETTLTYAIEFGKGSEVIFDFENGDKAGFMGFEEAKKWSQDNGVNNTLVGAEPLAGQFNEYLSSDTFISSTTNGGEVRNGNHALAWRLDNTDASFANWSYNVLFNTGDTIVLRDVANGMKATTLGMWVYIPVGAPGLAFQSQLYVPAEGGSYSCKQDHFMFTSAATGKQTNLNSATEADIPESRWVYMSIDISKYDYLCMPDAKDERNSRSPSFVRTYVKPTAPAELTFYIDDITLDYSSAVDDRVLPTITNPTYSTSDTAVSLENDATVTGNKIAFSATVADNAALDMTSGKIFVDGVEVKAAIAGNTLSSKEDVTLGAGAHTVAFEVKDELGNPMKITRTFTVAGDAVVELNGHNDSGETPKAQSVYYVDIKAANVTTLVAQLKLNNANTWETKGAFVADGYKATFSYNEISELLTVTVELENEAKAKSAGDVLVSIPVRVWVFDRYNYVTNTPYAPADMGNKPVVNIMCDVVYGTVDGVPFGGSINVATELTTISSPYHIHDENLTTIHKEPSLTEEGYENRTYCSTCMSVVDWGTKLEKLNHNYVRVGDQFVCQDEGCGHVYESGTGIFEMNGDLYYSINNVLKTGWQDAGDGKYCYADSATYALIIGQRTIGGFKYTFDENGITNGAWADTPKGKVYSYGPGMYRRAWAEIDGKDYYFDRNGYMYTGIRFIKANPDTDPVWYDFGETGATDRNMHPADGLYWVNGDLYYCKDGVSQFGLQYVDGYFYYFRTGSGFDRVGYATRNESYYVSNTNGLTFEDGTAVAKAWYDFDAEGKMVLKNGLIGGVYYENGKVVTYKGLIQQDGHFYYISANGKPVANKNYFISKTNDLTWADGTPVNKGMYSFDADGKMSMYTGLFEGYYYKNGIKTSYAGLIEQDGAFYYITSYGRPIVDTYYYISNTNGLTWADGTPVNKGMYSFDADGKMSIVTGLINGEYYKDSIKTSYAGLIMHEGNYYYISAYAKPIAGKSYYVSNTNGLTWADGTPIQRDTYTFDEDGKMILKHGADADGYFYLNGAKQKAYQLIKFEGNFYFISDYNKYVVSKTVYLSAKHLDGTGLKPGYYMFDGEGKMIIPE